mmetsp:Transcript_13149/g.21558  ORF Transcript_13149/g.21558 Transcript_13149/m.21558 type:complete len:222 (-) Transcript_13149:267-932(-)
MFTRSFLSQLLPAFFLSLLLSLPPAFSPAILSLPASLPSFLLLDLSLPQSSPVPLSLSDPLSSLTLPLSSDLPSLPLSSSLLLSCALSSRNLPLSFPVVSSLFLGLLLELSLPTTGPPESLVLSSFPLLSFDLALSLSLSISRESFPSLSLFISVFDRLSFSFSSIRESRLCRGLGSPFCLVAPSPIDDVPFTSSALGRLIRGEASESGIEGRLRCGSSVV